MHLVGKPKPVRKPLRVRALVHFPLCFRNDSGHAGEYDPRRHVVNVVLQLVHDLSGRRIVRARHVFFVYQSGVRMYEHIQIEKVVLLHRVNNENIHYS